MKIFPLLAALAFAGAANAAAPTDAEIAHIAYTAGELDIAAAKQALADKAKHDLEAKAAAEKAISMRESLGLVGKTFGLVKGKFSLVDMTTELQDLLQQQLDAALGKAKQ